MKIGFCGTHSTGKTTLVEALKTEPLFRDKYITDVNVTRWVKSLGFEINEKTSEHGQEINLLKRIAHIHSYPNIVADRTIIDVLAYSIAGNRRGHISDKSIEYQKYLVNTNISAYDYIFYLPMDIEVTDDGVRAIDPAFRTEIDDIITDSLHELGIGYKTVSGSVRQRVEQILNTIGENNI